MQDIKFDLKDINLIPAASSEVSSRSECQVSSLFANPATIASTYGNLGMLPLLASPMDTVVDEQSVHEYLKNQIIPCVPRGQYYNDIQNSFYFQSYGLSEIEEQIKRYYEYHNTSGDEPKYDEDPNNFYFKKNILIDIANGHMTKLITLVKEIKELFPNLQLMIGNVANPETFKNLAEAGADFVRCSVGSGAGCTTAANVAVNYPLGSLITECHALKVEHKLKAKIVADGGMQNFDDIIKALALGADYVMIGSIFNKAIESAGFNYLWKFKINNKIARKLWRWDFPIKKKYRGMSTKSVQRSWGKSKLVTAEGITKFQKVEYNLSQWTDNFKDYLRSTMSYCGAKTLKEFIGKAKWIFISNAARQRFEK